MSIEITQSKIQQEKKTKKSEQIFRNIWDIINHIYICIIGVPEGQERQKGQKEYLKK